MTIDRINVDGDYTPDNCRWANKADQSINRRTTVMLDVFGEKKPVSHWAKDPRCGASSMTILRRISSGWDLQMAITTPSRERRPK